MQAMQATAVLKQLKIMRSQKQTHVQNLDRAISIFKVLTGEPSAPIPKRHLSVAARRAIGKSQKARWAKWRRKKNGK